MSTGGHDRRAFFRQLLRGATRAAEEVEALRRATDDAVPRTARLDETAEPGWHPVAAAPTTHLATLDELRTLCEEAGRRNGRRGSIARAHGLPPHAGGDGRSWLGGTPRAGSFEWPVWDGVELAFLGRIALAGLPHSALPAGGAPSLLRRRSSALRQPAGGFRRLPRGARRGGPDEDEPLYGGMPFAAVTPSAELTLPAAPALPTLDADELEEWTEVRERLAAAQGVELEERAASYHALHRLLGHPDTYAEGMEVDAELVSRGVDLEDEPFADVSDEEQSSAADAWTLLLQVSNDDDLALDLGDASRLFVWIRCDDLTAGRFDRVHAFVR